MSKRKPTAASLSRDAFKYAIGSEKNTVKRARDQIALLTSQKETILAMMTLVHQYIMGFDMHSHLSFDWNDAPRLNFTVYDAPGFKDERIIKALEFLENWSSISETNENAEHRYRNFKFCGDGMTVCFNVYVVGDSPTCKRVEIGEETITRKKYAIQCD